MESTIQAPKFIPMELMEDIFNHLNHADLEICQFVNKRFHKVSSTYATIRLKRDLEQKSRHLDLANAKVNLMLAELQRIHALSLQQMRQLQQIQSQAQLGLMWMQMNNSLAQGHQLAHQLQQDHNNNDL